MNSDIAVDEQTGKVYKLHPESKWGVAAAVISMFYLIGMMVFLSWLFFDFSVGQYAFLSLIKIKVNTDAISQVFFKLIVYTILGGGLGGTINGIRSIVVWHSERRAFGWRFVWKYVSLPFTGIVLSAIVYAIIRGGITAFTGSNSFAPVTGSDSETVTQALSAFAIGALTGYGSNKVFVWLDDQVNRMLKITVTETVRVPDLFGKTKAEAEKLLEKVELALGESVETASPVEKNWSRIVEQQPAANTPVPKGTSINVKIAARDVGGGKSG